MRLRFITSGESHGKALTGILEGLPSGLELSGAEIDSDLKRRQGGHGRGGRMKIETDHAELLSGVRWGRTLGSPIAVMVENKDWLNWSKAMSSEVEDKGSKEPVTRPRPGHADLSGVMKYDTLDARDILERSSARETAMRVALGAIAKKFLSSFGIRIGSYVTGIAEVIIEDPSNRLNEEELNFLFDKAEASAVRCPVEDASAQMIERIDKAKLEGDSLGGTFTVFATGLPIGLGSHIQWDSRIEGRLAQAVMSIQAIKGVAVGGGFDLAKIPGSAVMDVINYSDGRFGRESNNAGGIEGGMTNGMPLIVKAAMKPIPTQGRPLKSVDIVTKETVEAAYERSDVCAVPAAGVVGEAMVALVLADAMLEKFGGDSMQEIKRNYTSYIDYLNKF